MKNFVQRPIWDWGEQFSEQDIALFYNPLYVGHRSMAPSQRLSMASVCSRRSVNVTNESGRLEPCTNIAAIELWSQCYERWLPPLDAPGAGKVQYYLYNCALRTQIQKLNARLSSLSIMNDRNGDDCESAPAATNTPALTRFYPFSLKTADNVTRNLDAMQVSLIDATELLDSQSLLNAPD
ncbi:unnamed protein product [Leptosia nina]|uniref:Myotubularin phosphatase domain-containing protein n=1 Tax=Leptosia nina TaxID=320188 RepID=A0AAV1J1B1_9NEOP